MANTLGTLTLPDQMQWIDQHDVVPVAQELDTTLGGAAVAHTAGLSNGLPITLQAAPEVAWLTTDQVLELKQMASLPGATYTLDWEGQTYTVMFAHHRRALNFIAVLPFADYWTGEVQLITI